jgi:predicted MPP superfamily phosphohydrolase
MLALVVPPAIGHFYHFVLLINVTSGLGFREHTMDRARTVLFAGFWASSALLLWAHLHDPWWSWRWPFRSYALLCVLSGMVLSPLASWRLARRRQPEGIEGSTRAVDLARTLGKMTLIGAGRRSWLLHLPNNESFRLRLREWELSMPGLPTPLDGLSIVHISDLHVAPCFERLFFESVLSSCVTWQADLVVITGDLIEHVDMVDWIEPLLGPLKARLGKFAILGNHDAEHQPQAIIRELGRAGFVTLEGQWTRLEIGETSLALGGTSEPWGPALDGRGHHLADFRVLLSHSPDLFYKAQDWGIDLMFAGHNHGGQIRLPLVGPVFMPSRFSRRFDRGFFGAKGTLMYVSEGVAGKHPVRYGCPPEVGRFVLRPAAGPLGWDRDSTPRRRRRAFELDMTDGAQAGTGRQILSDEPAANRVLE